MWMDMRLQIVVAQLWFISYVSCYPGYSHNNRPDVDEKHVRVPRALTDAFMPGFGKRQDVQHENEAGGRHQPAYGSYGSSLAGTRSRPAPYSALDFGSNQESMLDGDAQNDFEISKAALRALILDYLGKAEKALDSSIDDTVLPGSWSVPGNRDRLPSHLGKFKLLSQRLGRQEQPWGAHDYSEDSFKK